MKKMLALALALSLGLVITACSSDKAPAEAAIAAANAAFDAIKSDARVYAPDQYKAVEDAFAAVNDLSAKGNYTQALADAKGLLDKVAALKTAAEEKRTALNKSWTDLSAGLPGVVESIKSRVDILSQAKKLPKELSAESFDAAKTGLDMMNQTWKEAADAFGGGNLIDAVAKAETVKAKAAEVMGLLGMAVPDALK